MKNYNMNKDNRFKKWWRMKKKEINENPPYYVTVRDDIKILHT
jgi:hypothetical protein